MKLLYVSSCHPTLEYNDLCLFTEMGIDCVSTGIYANPKEPLKRMVWRGSPPKLKYDQQSIGLFKGANSNYFRSLRGYDRPRLVIPKNLASKFDVIVCNSFTHYIEDNWEAIKGNNVIWRTYGDSSPRQEQDMKVRVQQGLRIVRGTSNELKKPNCAGGSIISCHIDESLFSNWNGQDPSVLSFQNAFHIRSLECQGKAYMKIRESMEVPFKLFGDYSHLHELVQGFLSPEGQLSEYQRNQVYFSIGSHPAPITFNFMEALTTGIPVVTFGYEVGGAPKNTVPSYYQVPEFITHGVNGFVSDDLLELTHIIQELLINKELRESISKEARKSAIVTWGKEAIKNRWKEYFKEEGLW